MKQAHLDKGWQAPLAKSLYGAGTASDPLVPNLSQSQSERGFRVFDQYAVDIQKVSESYIVTNLLVQSKTPRNASVHLKSVIFVAFFPVSNSHPRLGRREVAPQGRAAGVSAIPGEGIFVTHTYLTVTTMSLQYCSADIPTPYNTAVGLLPPIHASYGLSRASH